MSFTYKYPRPALTVDVVVFKKTSYSNQILLIERLFPPFEHCWAFPGGFVNENELLNDAANRELFEETGLKNINLRQFYTFDAIDRDPRHRTISVVYIGKLTDEQPIAAGDDAANAVWFDLNTLPPLAFDHGLILQKILAEKQAENN